MAEAWLTLDRFQTLKASAQHPTTHEPTPAHQLSKRHARDHKRRQAIEAPDTFQPAVGKNFIAGARPEIVHPHHIYFWPA
jgi:hypothetical protein